MVARIAKSLDTLRSQVNAAYPNRSKSSDGWIGDPAHAARKSDHNPNTAGVVQAFDITHDPAHGLDAGKLAETLLASRDPRIKFIISNSRIVYSSDWKWQTYTGANAHKQHVHVSVVNEAARYDDVRPWNIGATVPAPPAPSDGLVDPTSENIKKLQADINALKISPPLKVDGDLGPATFAAITKLVSIVSKGENANA